jgi:hypothetical protein
VTKQIHDLGIAAGGESSDEVFEFVNLENDPISQDPMLRPERRRVHMSVAIRCQIIEIPDDVIGITGVGHQTFPVVEDARPVNCRTPDVERLVVVLHSRL